MRTCQAEDVEHHGERSAGTVSTVQQAAAKIVVVRPSAVVDFLQSIDFKVLRSGSSFRRVADLQVGL